MKEVGGPSFFSLLVITVSFLPIFALEAQEGRLFKPLAFTKTFSMAFAALLAITLDPAMRLLFTRLDRFTLPTAPGSAGRRQRRPRRHDPRRGDAPDQPAADARSTTRSSQFVLRFRWLTIARRAHRGRVRPCPSTSGSAPSSCRRSTRARSSTCRRPCPGMSITQARAASRRRTAAQAVPGGRRASSARPAAPRRRPIRRRSAWSRRS